MPDTTVRVEYIGAVQNFSEVTITGNQQVWRIGSSAFVETGRASQLVASGKFRSLANDPAMLPANQAKVGATPSESGLELLQAGSEGGLISVASLGGAKFEWSPNGYWRPLNGRAVIYSLPAPVLGATGNNEQILAQCTIPAGALRVGSRIQIFAAVSKLLSGVPDTVDTQTMRVRAGAGAVSDITIGAKAGTTSAHEAAEFILTVESLTSLVPSGVNTATPFSGPSGVALTPVTVPDVSTTPLVLSLTNKLTTGTPNVQGRTFIIELIQG